MKTKIAIPWVLGLGLLMETVDTTVLNTAIPQMASSFQVNPLTMKLAIVIYLLTLAIFILISGYFAERYGAKKIFLFAMAVFLGSSLLCGLSTSLCGLVIGRLLQGIGGAIMTRVGRLLLLKLFAGAEFVQAFSSLALIGQIGVILGPALGGALTSWLDWRWVFFINLPIGVVALALATFLLPKFD